MYRGLGNSLKIGSWELPCDSKYYSCACCDVIPCSLCVTITSFPENGPSGGFVHNRQVPFDTVFLPDGTEDQGYFYAESVYGVNWEIDFFWDDNCDFVVRVQDQEVYRKLKCDPYAYNNPGTCGCPSGEVSFNLDDGEVLLSWDCSDKILTSLNHEGSGCERITSPFCGNCRCACNCLCVIVSAPASTDIQQVINRRGVVCLSDEAEYDECGKLSSPEYSGSFEYFNPYTSETEVFTVDMTLFRNAGGLCQWSGSVTSDILDGFSAYASDASSGDVNCPTQFVAFPRFTVNELGEEVLGGSVRIDCQGCGQCSTQTFEGVCECEQIPERWTATLNTDYEYGTPVSGTGPFGVQFSDCYGAQLPSQWNLEYVDPPWNTANTIPPAPFTGFVTPCAHWASYERVLNVVGNNTTPPDCSPFLGFCAMRLWLTTRLTGGHIWILQFQYNSVGFNSNTHTWALENLPWDPAVPAAPYPGDECIQCWQLPQIGSTISANEAYPGFGPASICPGS